MKNIVCSGVVCLLSNMAFAECQNLDGNWNLNISTTPAALAALGFRTDTTQTKITIAGNAVTLNQATTLVLTTTNQAVYVDYDQPTSGTITVNPRTCRLRMAIVYAKQSVNTSNTTTFKGDFVKVTRGYAGKAASNSGGVATQATFEMTPG